MNKSYHTRQPDSIACLKVVIITNLGQRQNQHKMLKIQQNFPILYRCLLYVVFHDLEPKMQGLLMLKGIYIKKDQREFLCAKT